MFGLGFKEYIYLIFNMLLLYLLARTELLEIEGKCPPIYNKFTVHLAYLTNAILLVNLYIKWYGAFTGAGNGGRR